jgi:hypothetical protein
MSTVDDVEIGKLKQAEELLKLFEDDTGAPLHPWKQFRPGLTQLMVYLSSKSGARVLSERTTSRTR